MKLQKRKKKKPNILSVIEPYCNDGFVHSSDHLSHQLQCLFKPIFLESNCSELLTLAENYVHKEVTPAMVDHLAQLTHEQSKSKNWFPLLLCCGSFINKKSFKFSYLIDTEGEEFVEGSNSL